MKLNHQPTDTPRGEPSDDHRQDACATEKCFYNTTQEKFQTLNEIAHAINAKRQLTKHGAILLILRELAEVNKGD